MYKIEIISSTIKDVKYFTTSHESLLYFRKVVNNKKFFGTISLYIIENAKEIEIISTTKNK